MLGLIQDAQLLTSATLAYAARVYPRVEIVTADNGKPVHRTSYAETERRARLLASSLERLGLTSEDTFLGALAWNTWRLFEVMHAVPGGPYSDERNLPPEQEANLRASMKLDQPYIVQYWDHLSSLFVLDFKQSYRRDAKV